MSMKKVYFMLIGSGGIDEPLPLLVKQTPLIADLVILAPDLVPGMSEDKPKRLVKVTTNVNFNFLSRYVLGKKISPNFT